MIDKKQKVVSYSVLIKLLISLSVYMIDDNSSESLFQGDDEELDQEVAEEEQARPEYDKAKAYFNAIERPTTVAAYMPCVKAWMVKLKY